MESDADAFARLAHDLYDQANLEKTVEKIVESAVTVVGCDYAGLLMTSKGNQCRDQRKRPGRRESRQTADRIA